MVLEKGVIDWLGRLTATKEAVNGQIHELRVLVRYPTGEEDNWRCCQRVETSARQVRVLENVTRSEVGP